MNKYLLTSLMIAMLSAAHADVSLNFKDKPLAELLSDIKAQSGIDFELNPSLVNDKLTLSTQGAWRANIESILSNYNYEKIWDDKGNLKRVIISGRIGSAPQANQNLFEVDPSTVLPSRYRDLKPGSVIAITLPTEKLNQMKLGEKIKLSLPIGQFSIVHDNRFEHENGDITWVGHLDDKGPGYRAIITQGENGNIGQIVTPEGIYLIESEEGHTWLVDVQASGLQSGSFQNDGKAAFNAAPSPKAPVAKKIAQSNAQTASTTIDVMILYTPGMNSRTVDTRINYLFALANQAYIDSKVNLKIRLVGKQLINYTDANDNGLALDALTQGVGVFSSIRNLRNQTGADLVSLIRPFHSTSQGSCGIAWINGSYGGYLTAGNGYSVVSDGADGSGFYCNDYALAHELGHNMGSAHDHAHSDVPGKYAFSYGYGFNGRFGTIMSYYRPTVGLFSSPNLNCQGGPCGKASSADNARSINLTSPTIANFLPTRK